MKIVHAGLAALMLLGAGCAHQVTFDRPAAYTISEPRQDVGVIAVIDPNTLASKVAIRAFMAGIANTWEAYPGDMLKQVADIELPQMFSRYTLAEAYVEPAPGAREIVLELTIPSYVFAQFRAWVSVTVTVYDRGRRNLMLKTYTAEGETQGAKMYFTGAYGMKSAIRQSSLDAYKKIFAELRPDLIAALRN